MRLALKFGYDGTGFYGYQRQPGVRTVEGEVITALRKMRIIESAKESRFKSASRTDRHVSALGNVIAFDTKFRRDRIIRALNSKLEDIFFWAVSEVPNGFNPRQAKMRWYRYHLPKELDIGSLREASTLFVGEHDFAGFCRKSERSTVRKIDSIEIRRGRSFLHLDIKGQSFLWNMVRRIVSALLRFAQGEIRIEMILQALEGESRYLGLAPAEPLFLMDVSYDFEFDVNESEAPSKLLERYEVTRIKWELYEGLRKRFKWLV